MSGIEVPWLVVLGAGFALVLSEIRWFRQSSLADRLRPYAPPTTAGTSRRDRRSTAAAVLLPPLQQLGARVTAALGITDGLAVRLERAGMVETPAAFRLRQLTHSLVGLALGGIVAITIRPGPLLALVLVVGLPALAALLEEHRISRRIDERRRMLQLELPVIAEQLGVLIDAGWSLPAALQRIGSRGRGVAAEDLRRVSQRIRQGLGESDALAEWARRIDQESVRRLVGVLALHREAGDLGRLIAAEARAIRATSHRDLVERIERRSQAVWIPVTVATLVPGLLFLAVPFMSALSQVTGT